MNKKILLIFTLCVFFGLFCLFQSKSKKTVTYKILEVVEADKFYIDINRNNKIDQDELFHLKDIVAFRPIKNKYTIQEAQKLGYNIEDYLKNGYLANLWAKEEYIGKYAQIKDIQNKIKNKKVTLIVDNKNVAYELLKRGLASIDSNCKDVLLLSANSRLEAKLNLEAIKNVKFYALNLKTKIVHDLKDEHFEQMKNALLILEKEISSYSLCKTCFNKVHLDFSKLSKDEFDVPKAKGVYKTSQYKNFSNLELFLLNPLEFNKPSKAQRTKFSKRLAEEVNNSKETIDIVLYGIEEEKEFIEALKEARKRGVKIRAVVDYSKNMDNIYKGTKDFIQEFSAKTDKTETLMHDKFIVFDKNTVFTGSINLSPTGAQGYNSNVAVIIKNKELASFYEKEFEQMYNGKFSKRKENFETKEVKLDDILIKPYFLPQNDVFNEEILPEIQKAKQEIFVSIFYLTDKTLIEELIKAKNRGVKVLVLVDALSATNFKDRIMTLRKAKIPTKVENWGGKNHEKTIMIDSRVLFVGSANFSKSGFYKNDENVLKISSSKIAKFYRDYYLYLFNSIDRKFYYTIPRAEGLESINSCFDGLDNNYDGKIDKEDEACKKQTL